MNREIQQRILFNGQELNNRFEQNLENAMNNMSERFQEILNISLAQQVGNGNRNQDSSKENITKSSPLDAQRKFPSQNSEAQNLQGFTSPTQNFNDKVFDQREFLKNKS